MGYGGWLDPFELQRFSAISAITGRRLVVVETPGIGLTGTRLSWLERRQLVRGRFRALGSRLLAVADDVAARVAPIDGWAPSSVTGLLGYSLGCSIVSGMAAAAQAQGRSLAEIVLVEPVGAQRRSLRRLIARVRQEDDVVDEYLDETVGVRGMVPPSDRLTPAVLPWRHRGDQGLLGAALAGGRLGSELPVLEATRLVLVRGSTSFLVGPEAVQRLVAQVRVRDVTEIVLPGGHGLWHSVPRVRSLAHELVQVLGPRPELT